MSSGLNALAWAMAVWIGSFVVERLVGMWVSARERLITAAKHAELERYRVWLKWARRHAEILRPEGVVRLAVPIAPNESAFSYPEYALDRALEHAAERAP